VPNPVLTRAIDALASGSDLAAQQAADVLAEIMAGDASEVETAAVLIALRTKGETIERSSASHHDAPARGARDHGPRRPARHRGDGGGRPDLQRVDDRRADRPAGAGCAVAKHGNRPRRASRAPPDLLEALGVRIDLGPEAVARCIEEVGFGFMFAPAHHGATRFVVPVRKELAVRTIFNFLGPLTNPAAPRGS
jgi:anthranilate phosphoribosyltransferase